MELATAIVSHIPTWVWAILGYIVFMGLKQTGEMRVSRLRLLALPAFWLCFGAWGVIGHYGLVSLPTVLWIAGLGLGLTLMLKADWAGRLGARYDAESSRYVVPGSWVPLALMLSIFIAKFAQGVLLAMHPAWGAMIAVQLGTGLAFGTISGAMLGRSVSVLRTAFTPARSSFA
ncbi:DUF6622 family protein [Burkholderiaceae bacterium UC74_6]